MAAAQAGDEESYGRLLEELQPILQRYVRRRIRDVDAAEDICQDTLLTVHRVRHTFDPSRPFEPWFYTIARSRLLDSVRRSGRRRRNEIEVVEMPEATGDLQAVGWEHFLEILDALPDTQREAFMLLKVEGLSTVEAAERSGVSVAALKVRAHRAYTTLKGRVLEEEDGA